MTTPIIAFSANRLTDIIAKSKKASTGGKGGGDGEFQIRRAFLQPGTHKLRIFGDTNSELTRELVTHSHDGKTCLCPNDMMRRDKTLSDLPTCKICEMIEAGYGDWKTRRYQATLLAQLIETNAPNDYWKPGNVYLVIGNSRLQKSVINFVDQMAQDATDWVLAMLNPNIAGGYISMTVEGGAQGSVAIIPIMTKTSPPPTDFLPAWKTLPEYYMPEFDPVNYHKIIEDLEKTIPTVEADDASEDVPAPQVSAHDVATPAVEPAVAPVTPPTTPAVDPARVGLPPVGLDVPANVATDRCFGQYDTSRPPCAICPINLECMEHLIA